MVEGGEVEEAEEDGFQSTYFVGDWLDNLGHRILVSPPGPRSGLGSEKGRRRGKGGRKGGRGDREGAPLGSGGLGFLAVLQKPGLPEKRFTIAKDRGGNEWTCGNGRLVRDESDAEALVWLASDGRRSRWARTPPEGPVYFDAPPAPHVEELPESMRPPWMQEMHGGMTAEGQPTIYFVLPPEVAMQPGEGPIAWEVPAHPGDAGWDEAPATEGPQHCGLECFGEGQASAAAGEAEVGVAAEAAAAASAAAGGFGAGAWNPSAPAFVPSAASGRAPVQAPAASMAPPPVPRAARTSPSPMLQPRAAASPMLRPAVPWASPRLGPAHPGTPLAQRRNWGRTPTPSPKMGPVPSPKLGHMFAGALGLQPAPAPAVPKPPPTVHFTGESPDICVNGPRLEWCLPEPWGQLRTFPKDFCITSPMFGVRLAATMQLAFYPSGSRTAEEGLCTVALTRGPDSAGIKFEFLVNGRGIGPKVCLGRRYLGDYPRPFDETEESAARQVVICMHVLEILGGGGVD